jgi:molybdenum cofactor cytidylyltransferase/nicotine blue oxidoreductase
MKAAPDTTPVTGLLLAAGAGRRMGTPKALLRTESGQPWLHRGVTALRDGGCDAVAVVLGASYDEAVRLLPDPTSPDLDVVRADDWQEGMGASLRAGLRHLLDTTAQAAVVTLVDLPDVGGEVVGRVLRTWRGHERPAAALARAVYDGRPGHPVVIGRDHWEGVLGSLAGDVGAQAYLSRVDVRRTVDLVECADLATGRDVDEPPGSGS